MGEWKHIETAPKDGSDILVICMNAANPRAGVSHWRGCWVACEGGLFDELGMDASDIGVYPDPTFWRPLPGPPQ